MKPWEEVIREAVAVDGLHSEKYSEKRSALRKAFAICLEGTHQNWTDPEWVQNKWETGTWQDHIKLTRPSAAGIAACFGAPANLIAQMVALHFTNSTSFNPPYPFGALAGEWVKGLLDHGSCADATRGDGKSFGLPQDWDMCPYDEQEETFLDYALDFAREHWGMSVMLTPAPKAKSTPKPTSTDIDPVVANAINTMLEQTGMPKIEDITKLQAEWGDLVAECAELREKLSKASTVTTMAPVSVDASGDIPSGNIALRNAAEVFEVTGKEAKHFDFEVPVGVWDAPHPHVPAKDDDYVFGIDILVPVLLAIVTGRIPWLKGHTGTGKTTLVEQVYARLNLPLFRLNLDSDITRGELVGREVLRTDSEGNTVTEFVEGIIPMAMQQPCGLLLDEVDASRPDLGFVLQRLTEGKGFMLLEDGGRTIMPHPHFRMFATANTNGRGDETGLYSGTRALGTAFVNRFKPYIEVDYMSEAEEAQLLQEKITSLDGATARSIAAYATEHRVAFKQADVTLACSPRDTMAFASAYVNYQRTLGTEKSIDTMRLAFEHSILNAADSDDRQVLDGLVARVFKQGE